MRHEKILLRDTGREVKIVSQVWVWGCDGSAEDVDTFVLYRNNPKQDWTLCKNKSEYNTRTMSREDYMAYGKPEFLQMVSIGELLKSKRELLDLMAAKNEEDRMVIQ